MNHHNVVILLAFLCAANAGWWVGSINVFAAIFCGLLCIDLIVNQEAT